MASLPGARAPHDANSPSALPEFDSQFLEDILACPACGAELSGSSSFETYGICGNCQRHFPLPARERLRLLVDGGSFQETNAVLVSLEPLVFRDVVPGPDRLEATRSLLRRDDTRGWTAPRDFVQVTWLIDLATLQCHPNAGGISFSWRPLSGEFQEDGSHRCYPTWTTGRLSGSVSALRRISRVVGAMSPSPKKMKRARYFRGFPSAQPK